MAARPDREDVAQTAQHELLAEFSHAPYPSSWSVLRPKNVAHHDLQIRTKSRTVPLVTPGQYCRFVGILYGRRECGTTGRIFALKELYDRFSRGDLDGAAEVWTDNVVWEYHASGIPGVGAV